MRTDVKVGIALGAIVLIVAGAYYGANKDPDIQLAGGDPDVREQNKRTLSELLAPPAHDPKSATNKNRPTVGSQKARPAPRTPARALDSDTRKRLNEPIAKSPPRDPGANNQTPEQSERLPNESPAAKNENAGPELPPVGTPTGIPKPNANLMERRSRPAVTSESRTPAQSPASAKIARTLDHHSERQLRETPKPSARTRFHVVALEDNFSTLAARYYGSQSYAGFLVNANPNIDPRRMKIGSRVKIPPLNSNETTARARNDAREVGTRHYSVQEGDSLYAIADAKLGTGARWNEIYALNKALIGADPSRLTVGVVLVLPAN